MKPTFRRRRLGKRLKALRDAAGMSLDDAAPALDMSRSALHRIETGENKPNVHLARSMMDLYDQYDDGLLEAIRLALKPNWFSTYDIGDLGYVDAETEASVVYEHSLNL